MSVFPSTVLPVFLPYMYLSSLPSPSSITGVTFPNPPNLFMSTSLASFFSLSIYLSQYACPPCHPLLWLNPLVILFCSPVILVNLPILFPSSPSSLAILNVFLFLSRLPHLFRKVSQISSLVSLDHLYLTYVSVSSPSTSLCLSVISIFLICLLVFSVFLFCLPVLFIFLFWLPVLPIVSKGQSDHRSIKSLIKTWLVVMLWTSG